MKTLVDLCHGYGIPIVEENGQWTGPCIWSFDESQSLILYPEQDRWEDWIMGFSGGLLAFVMMVEERLQHLGKNKFSADDWHREAVEEFEDLPW